MDTYNLQKQFGRMGARLEFEQFPVSRRRDSGFSLDIRRDKHGPFFGITLSTDIVRELIVLDLQPKQRHLLLLVRHHVEERTTKHKYLCGHDERDWFVAAIPEVSGVSNVRTAMEALKPAEVVAAQNQMNVKMRNRNRRRNEAFVRQGEWFFLPAPEINPAKWMIIHDEPLIRGQGKPHMAETLYRYGGKTIYVNRQYPNGLSEENYRRLVKLRDDSVSSVQVRRIDPSVYVKGRITHHDHKTVILDGWHRVISNTEHLAVAMRHLRFID